MTPKHGGRRISDSDHHKGGNNGETKKIRKSAELFAVPFYINITFYIFYGKLLSCKYLY